MGVTSVKFLLLPTILITNIYDNYINIATSHKFNNSAYISHFCSFPFFVKENNISSETRIATKYTTNA